jgi:hypothetical protein
LVEIAWTEQPFVYDGITNILSWALRGVQTAVARLIFRNTTFCCRHENAIRIVVVIVTDFLVLSAKHWTVKPIRVAPVVVPADLTPFIRSRDLYNVSN